MFHKFVCTSLLVTLLVFSLFAQEQLVFVSGQEGHATYRIPAIISLPNGELLAFAEGRVNGSDDYGDVNLVMKRSPDQGITWSGIETLLDYDSLQAGNPAPVVDLLDPDTHRGLFTFFTIPETTTSTISE
ncbi:MAG: sialidase family protein [Algoriphagus sp.]|uniref:sialidase family protein n=1 Tax=Algoriphagus sp. TaxID=1872435 RepID=UPI00272F2078|nr:sialidase family protein [Algoriphagus sp.]MDP2041706.1 sialidase family protein [Algoriphagus sp.]MDP3473800.1 sialidase family protein [Algoriphagus sp.]